MASAGVAEQVAVEAKKPQCIGYRHDPYASVVFVDEEDEAEASALKSYEVLYKEAEAKMIAAAAAAKAAPVAVQEPVVSSDGFVLPLPASAMAAASRAKARQLSELYAEAGEEQRGSNDCSVDDGVSEMSSELGSAPRRSNEAARPRAGGEATACVDALAQTTSVTSLDLAGSAVAPVTLLRYASVNFRFGSAWFLAPFRTFVGDMVVVEYPSNHSLHMGLVSCISTEKPSTFYSEDNLDPNYLTEAEMQLLPRILRHARDCDKETKLDLRSHDIRSLASAQALAEEMQAPVMFLDAEWLLDLTAVTFLVHVYGDVTLVDRLADELAAQEGAEVVFTYPAVGAEC